MMPKKCPRCEINYLMDGEKICSVCRKSVHMEDEPDEIVEMCSECGEHPAMPGSELCAFCRKELARRTPVVSMPEDEIEPSLQMDSVATMDEIELDLGDDLGDELPDFLDEEDKEEAEAEEEEEDGECYILKDVSKAEDSDAVYEFVENDDEMDYLFKIFTELMEDMEVDLILGKERVE